MMSFPFLLIRPFKKTEAVSMYVCHMNIYFSAGPGPFCDDCADPAHHSHCFSLSSISRA